MGMKELMYNMQRGRFTQDMWYRRFDDQANDISAEHVQRRVRGPRVAEGPVVDRPAVKPVRPDAAEPDE
jgi:hypothetical protein